ncbi:hypothetical protein L1F30_11130 [Simiduia sp. 21SJ11W-1]|uniref:hypothetical protein n=1 Tax=Simiduia sp. 21SJ11W-1 TaxID=2909669 RepID=UPI0020A1C096|nr:hypothetical protein [Simiduia sp. 21SJ11W-1]UTA46715.1 hypothetical protein L1F30_11130 [Simiduia sp. 21SJ11W-1]
MPNKAKPNKANSHTACSAPGFCLAIGLMLLAGFGSQAHALSLSDCLASAKGYYQQTYCELVAQGEGRQLPAFFEFTQNNEQTQWLLLKRPAERAGINLCKPKPSSPRKSLALQNNAPAQAGNSARTPDAREAVPQATPRPPQKHAATASIPASFEGNNCALAANTIVCGAQHFSLQRNLHNRHLSAGALGPENTLALPPFNGNLQDEQAVRAYLYQAYATYLTKMRSIGLGGITTSFGNFSYLFYDYHAKGLDFSQRFAKLFHYLKKDKASLPVSERAADISQLSLADCSALNSEFFVCEHRGKNLLFAR